jgi:TPR repeat protein
MTILGIRILLLSRGLLPLFLVTAFPATADIDTSSLRSATKAGAAAPAGATAASTRPAAKAEESANDWYRQAIQLDRPGASDKDLTSAAFLYKKAAEQGHTDAQTNLAAMYAEGRGVDISGTETVRWYLEAAKAGNVRAQYNLALMYHLGEGITRDYDGAIEWYENAARQGDANAMNNMAFMYGMGEGVVQSDIEAYVWFALAASRGNADARENRDLAASEMTPEELRKARERYTQLEQQLGL